jgi:hypothetical protein
MNAIKALIGLTAFTLALPLIVIAMSTYLAYCFTETVIRKLNEEPLPHHKPTVLHLPT